MCVRLGLHIGRGRCRGRHGGFGVDKVKGGKGSGNLGK